MSGLGTQETWSLVHELNDAVGELEAAALSPGAPPLEPVISTLRFVRDKLLAACPTPK
jgi:hypothetical protein